jgi:hypothetical protein
MTDEPPADPNIEELVAAGERRKEELLAMAGGLLDEEQVAGRLGWAIAELRDRARAGKLVAVVVAEQLGYPICPISGHGIVPGLESALSSMPIRSDWMRLEWLLTPDPDLNGRSPLIALKADEIEQVIELARSQGSHG